MKAPYEEVCGLLAVMELSRHVRLARGSLRREERLATVPLRCQVADDAGLFPCLEATLEIMPLANGEAPVTELCLVGRY
ncbi:MAG: hypothetical protein ACRDG9_14505, partial [Actinomycetota bacterium]